MRAQAAARTPGEHSHKARGHYGKGTADLCFPFYMCPDVASFGGLHPTAEPNKMLNKMLSKLDLSF